MSHSTVDTQDAVSAQRLVTQETQEVRAPAGWVPVERRWLGFDKATIAPSAIVLGLALVMLLLVPRINDQVPYDDPVRDGDVLSLEGGVTFVPPTGWGITDGVRQAAAGDIPRTTPSATIVKGDLQVTVTAAPFEGDSDALLAQIKETDDALDTGGPVASGPSSHFTTASGLDGVASHYSGVTGDGLIAAFAQDGHGIKLVVTGPPGVARDNVRELALILASIDREAA